MALRVSDIDPARLTIRVEPGKGGKDPYVPLADRLRVELRRYWQVVPPAQWVFPVRREAQGLRLHARTACPGWLGERLDLGWGIGVLHPLATRAVTG